MLLVVSEGEWDLYCLAGFHDGIFSGTLERHGNHSDRHD